MRALDRGELREAWNQFVKRYVEECRNWRLLSVMIDSVGEQGEINALLDASYGLWGHIWHEHDLVLNFSFTLKRRIEDTGTRLHLHIAYKLKPENFIYFQGFSKNLSRAVKTLRRSLHLGGKWYPELDLIVAGEEPPFPYCLEFKYYHYTPRSWSIVNDLRRKIIVLKTLKNLAICNDAGVAILDDAICRKDFSKCNEIKTTVDEPVENLLVLTHHVTYEELLQVLRKSQSSPRTPSTQS